MICDVAIKYSKELNKDYIAKINYNLSRLYITLPILVFTIYYIWTNILPLFELTNIFLPFCYMIVVLLVASYIDLFLRWSTLSYFSKINLYPNYTITRITNEVTFLSNNTKKALLKEIFKYRIKPPYLDAKNFNSKRLLAYYYKYNGKPLSNRDIESFQKEIDNCKYKYNDETNSYDYPEMKESLYKQVFPFGEEALVEFYTQEAMKDFKFSFDIISIVLYFHTYRKLNKKLNKDNITLELFKEEIKKL